MSFPKSKELQNPSLWQRLNFFFETAVHENVFSYDRKCKKAAQKRGECGSDASKTRLAVLLLPGFTCLAASKT